MRLPGQHSLFWRLALLQLAFCVSIIWLGQSWRAYVNEHSYRLDASEREYLLAAAGSAELAWREDGEAGVERWLAEFRQREGTWAALVGADLQSLGAPLLPAEYEHLSFLRRIEFPLSRRARDLPYLRVPFPQQPASGQLVLQLPRRFLPSGSAWFAQLLVSILLPGLLALAVCVLIYRQLSRPLSQLRQQANALHGDQLHAGLAPQVSARLDELGELARAFDHMAERLQSTVVFQRQVLRDLSHELRTPLSRLRVAAERESDPLELRSRLTQELAGMERLLGDALEFVWLNTERPALPLEEVQVATLWELLRENACFESGWVAAQLPCALQADCRVLGNLNALAQALENVLRNAIRHSPEGGVVRLDGVREGGYWHLWIEDQGPGVAADQLEAIFLPFTRLGAARPGGDGFGLGLTIARSMLRQQGGDLWAENGTQGLRIHLRLETV